MSVPAWDSDLPQELFVNGYSQSPPNVTIKSEMDAGPAKVRRRFTAGVEPVSGTMIMDATELAALDTFYNTTLLGGSLRFSWTKPPAHSVACEMRFTEPPTWTAIEPGMYQVSMSFEVLP
jgi:hypothetical protein